MQQIIAQFFLLKKKISAIFAIIIKMYGLLPVNYLSTKDSCGAYIEWTEDQGWVWANEDQGLSYGSS